jgi:hypothetical protein
VDREEAVSVRNQASKKYKRRPTLAKRTEYEKKRIISDKRCRKKKRAALNEHLTKTSEEFKDKNLNMAFKDVKSEREDFKPNTDLCKDSLGRIIGDSQGINQRWKEYFQELLHGRAGMADDIINGENDLINDDNEDTASSEVPAFEEIKISLTALRNNIAPGADNMPAELLKCGGDGVVRLIHKLIMDIWEKEYAPKNDIKVLYAPFIRKETSRNA